MRGRPEVDLNSLSTKNYGRILLAATTFDPRLLTGSFIEPPHSLRALRASAHLKLGERAKAPSELPGGGELVSLFWKQLDSAHAYREGVVRRVSFTFLTPAETISWCATFLVYPTVTIPKSALELHLQQSARLASQRWDPIPRSNLPSWRSWI